MKTHGTLFNSHNERKHGSWTKWDYDKLTCKHELKLKSFAHMNKKCGLCKLKPKWCTNEPLTTQSTKHIIAQIWEELTTFHLIKLCDLQWFDVIIA